MSFDTTSMFTGTESDNIALVHGLEAGLFSKDSDMSSFEPRKYFDSVVEQVACQKRVDGGRLLNKMVMIRGKYPVVTDYTIDIIEMSRSNVIADLRSKKFNISFASIYHAPIAGTFLLMHGIDQNTNYILSMNKLSRMSSVVVHETDETFCSNDYKTYYYGPDSYHVSHCTPLPSVIYPLPEICIMMKIAGVDAFDMTSIVCEIIRTMK
jgi:hypothetical protein